MPFIRPPNIDGVALGATTKLTAITVDEDGIDVDPTGNADADLLTVGVSAAPKIFWDDSDVRFTTNVGIDLDGAVGIDFTPASDADTDLLTVNVGGTPRMFWDESEDRFSLTHGINIFPASADEELMHLKNVGGTNWTTYPAKVWGGFNASLADETACTFLTASIGAFFMLVTCRTGASVATALIGGRAASSPAATILSQGGAFTIAVSTSDVSGSTGTDGQVTVSVRDEVIEFENRAGGTLTIALLVIGGG